MTGRDTLARPATPFLAMHAAVTLLASRTRRGSASSRCTPTATAIPTQRAVVAPLARALRRLASGEHSAGADALARLQRQTVRLGGSDAQREILEETRIAALLRADRFEEARVLLDDRVDRRHSPRDVHWRRQCLEPVRGVTWAMAEPRQYMRDSALHIPGGLARMAQSPTMLSPLVHDRKGAGETVVLIHGIGHRRQAWDPVFDRLAERYDVIRLDLAGFGESPQYAKGTPYNMDNACADLTANFTEWGVDRPHVVGNSLGGAISLELAARGLVSSATVLSPAGFFGRIERLWPLIMLSLLKLASQLPDPFLRWNSRNRFGRLLAGFLLYVHPERTTATGTYGDSLAMKRSPAFYKTILAGVTYRLDASGLTVPTTVAWGTKDRLLWFRQSKAARRRIPKAHHVALPDCGQSR